MSSAVASSSTYAGLCSGNSRRPSMFTAKFRLREERKKVLKMSMGKVKRIEDPESFLRRSVLINNTIKRLQREVREEKMLKHGGYGAAARSCHSYRSSFGRSRLSDMHLTEDDSLSGFSSRSRSSSLLNNNSIGNDRKRTLSDESEDDCDVLSQIYIPPTPCVISSMDEEDSLSSCDSSPRKKAKLSMSEDGSSLLVTTDECSLDVDVDVDVDVVGDVETSDWPTPPSPPPVTEPTPDLLNPIISSALDDDPLCSSSPLDLDVDVDCGGGVCIPQGVNANGVIDIAVGDTSSLVVQHEDEDEEVDVDADCEFNLDLSTDENMSLTGASAVGTSALLSDPCHVTSTDLDDFHNELSNEGASMEDMSFDHCKENNCNVSDFSVGAGNGMSVSTSSPSPSSPSSLLPSIVQKCSNHSTSNNNNHSANDSFCSSCSSFETSPSSCLSSSAAASPSQCTNQASADKQYSSCGHSSIFGELQSVVFHSLIASLET